MVRRRQGSAAAARKFRRQDSRHDCCPRPPPPIAEQRQAVGSAGRDPDGAIVEADDVNWGPTIGARAVAKLSVRVRPPCEDAPVFKQSQTVEPPGRDRDGRGNALDGLRRPGGLEERPHAGQHLIAAPLASRVEVHRRPGESEQPGVERARAVLRKPRLQLFDRAGDTRRSFAVAVHAAPIGWPIKRPIMANRSVMATHTASNQSPSLHQ